MSTLLERARELLIRTITCYRDDPRTAAWLRGRLERIEQPLRIAVTGRVQSGKSTLINAFVGEPLAPTATEENTQVNTLYQYGPEPKVLVHTPHGSVQTIPMSTVDDETIRRLQHWRPDEVSRLVVEAPSPGLRAVSLLETPGVASTAVRETGQTALAQVLAEADAVLYLTRHPHEADLQFLQAAHELRTARRAPINTLVAISRADEAGASGSEALTAAEGVAEQHRTDPALQSYAQHVVPVIGLLGQAVHTMTEQDIATLRELLKLSEEDLQSLLLSADRFAHGKAPDSLPTEHRQALLVRFGHYGVQRALVALREGAEDAAQLRAEMLEASGMNALQGAVHQQFVERQDALRARSALLAVDMVLRANPKPAAQRLHGEFEWVLANAHEWDELRLLSALDSGQLRFARPLQAAAKRLLGAGGSDPASRLGCDEDAPADELAQAAARALAQWREQHAHPLHDRAHREAARTVLRTCEHLTTELAAG
ncbi:50S ribosome-binding GTPase [Salinifilum aidingensis]